MATQSSTNAIASSQSVDGTITSGLTTSELNIPTTLQRTDDFDSQENNGPEELVHKLPYYKDVNWARIPRYGPCPAGVGDSWT